KPPRPMRRSRLYVRPDSELYAVGETRCALGRRSACELSFVYRADRRVVGRVLRVGMPNFLASTQFFDNRSEMEENLKLVAQTSASSFGNCRATIALSAGKSPRAPRRSAPVFRVSSMARRDGSSK